MTDLERAALDAGLAQAAALERLHGTMSNDPDYMLTLAEYQIACDAAEQAFVALALEGEKVVA